MSSPSPAGAGRRTDEAGLETAERRSGGAAGRGHQTKPFAFLKLVEMISDRTEGKPTQHIVAERRPGAIFMLDREGQQPAPVTTEEAAAVVEPGTPPVVDLASLPVPAASPIPSQLLAVLPPPTA